MALLKSICLSFACILLSFISFKHANGHAVGVHHISSRLLTAGDVLKQHESNSKPLEELEKDCQGTGPSCITSCEGKLPDTSHQWCGGCTTVVYCQAGEVLTLVSCPPGNAWDDCQKRCVVGATSQTCTACYDPENGTIAECFLTTPAPTLPPAQCAKTGPSCVEDCNGRPDGDYQWCGRCDYYIACVAQAVTIRACPVNSPWDDCSKRCEVLSQTCRVCDNDNQLEVDCTVPTEGSLGSTLSTTPAFQCESTGPICHTVCNALPDGNYQYCGNCRQYLTCANGNTYLSPCSLGLIWDDDLKNCDRTSETCQECYYAPSPTEEGV